MVETQCFCGAVKIAIETPPEFINDCNCSLCRNSGAAWGYFSTAQVATSGQTSSFVRADRDEPAVAIHSCPNCHATTHWTLTDEFRAKMPEADSMGVNMRLFRGEALAGVEVRFPDGAAWSGEGDYAYRRPSFVVSSTEQF